MSSKTTRVLLAATLLAALSAAGSLAGLMARGSTAQVSSTDAPSGLQVLALTGRTVVLGWTAPSAGDAPVGYAIEGGVAPGEVLASIPVGAMTVTTFDAPAGAFFVRVHALSASGRSAASNEIRLFVETAAPPSSPVNLLGTVDGSTLVLSWTNTRDGGPVDRLWLQASGSLSGLLPIPVGESLVLPGVPAGGYTLRVIAGNDSGTSPPSNAVTLGFPGSCASGAPAPPQGFRAWRIGSTLSLAWLPPAHGPAITGYTVRVAGSTALTFATTARLVSAAVPDDNYVVSVEATGPCGTSAPAPPAPDWTVVTTEAGTHRAHWPEDGGGGGYRLFWSTSRQDLTALVPSVRYLDVPATPATLPIPAADQAVYYRIARRYGAVVGTPGPVAVAASFRTTDYVNWDAHVTPSLYDIDGDGCLDMVGARGRCGAGFEPYSMAAAGLGALTIDDVKSRDGRLADFTGDGIIDFFSNVYTRADDPAVKVLLHVGRGDGSYVMDPAIAAMNIVGFGETVLAADFDNDGDLDVFLPHYNHLDDGGRNWLLINDGQGHFHDVALAAGVAFNLHHPPEGAQALDWNNDGWVDIHVASHLFLNNGNLTFTDAAADLGLPVLFDEGLRLFDIDLDGDLDLAHNDTYVTRIHRNEQGRFGAGVAVSGAPDQSTFGFGLNVCDVNGDGFEDLIVSQNHTMSSAGVPELLLNAGGIFRRTQFTAAAPSYNDLLGCADFDNSGLPDIVGRWSELLNPATPETPPQGGYRTFTSRGEAPAIRLRVVGASGARNQQGRTVRLTPQQRPDLKLMRVVESGSGYMAQNGYDLLVSTPWPGAYDVEVRFKDGWVRTTARPGTALTIHEDGRVVTGLR